MKRLFIVLFIVVSLVACSNSPKSHEKSTPHNSIEWMGTYECDSIKIKFEKDGVCNVITPSAKLNADYSWDVEGTTICVVDERKNIYWLQVHEGYLTTADTNNKFIKIK